MKRICESLLVALLFLAEPGGSQEAKPTVLSFKAVVHADNPVKSLSKATLSRYLLRRESKWPDGSKVVPFDLAADHAVRRALAAELHGMSSAAITSYWQQFVFAGRGRPPLELKDEAAMLERIGGDRAAVGYVARDTKLPAGVRAVELVEEAAASLIGFSLIGFSHPGERSADPPVWRFSLWLGVALYKI